MNWYRNRVGPPASQLAVQGGTAYAPGSPILSAVMQPQPRQMMDPIVTEPKREMSLAELRKMPGAALQQMLDERGVSASAVDQHSLAKWVHQHQHLPVKPRPKPRVPPAHSLAELERMSVAQLREMLARRGVSGGSATEKLELAKWVWQHQHIPCHRQAAPEREEPKQLEATREPLQLEGGEAKPPEPPVARARAALVAAALVLLGLLAAVVANDARQAEER